MSNRESWTFDPFSTVGPLRFGMTPADVDTALDARPVVTSASHRRYDRPAVTAHFDSDRLVCITVSANTGPDVLLGGQSLTGQVPSSLETWLREYAQHREWRVLVSPSGNPIIGEAGLAIEVQRSGDAVVTMPILISEDWIDPEVPEVPEPALTYQPM